MKKTDENMKKIVDKIKSKLGNSPDLVVKETYFFDTKLYVVFSEPLIDKAFVDHFVLRYLTEEKLKKRKKPTNILDYFEQTIPTHKTTRLYNMKDIFYYVLNGFSIVLVDGYDEALALETKAQLDSGITESKNEKVIKGPKDAFTENYQTNVGLIRRRIKTEDLWLKEEVLGTKSKTKVGIMYIKNIADQKLVDKIIQKVQNITIDGIFDSNYVVELISGNKKKNFACYISTERPDQVCMHLLEGRIAIVVENTQYVAVIPAVFVDFFQTTEDFYQKVSNVNFTRIIRLIAFLVAIFIPAIYIAIATFNIEAIPEKLLMSFVTQREGVPLPTVLETLMMIIVFEILRETDARLPSAIGNSLSIVGAIVLGQAAVAAGVVSPITIIVVSITAISGMISSNMDMVGGIRWWRIIFLLSASIFGLFGIVLAGFIFIIYLSSMKSFGVPYLAPLAPFYPKEQNNAIFLTNKRKFENRPFLTAKKNEDRTGG